MYFEEHHRTAASGFHETFLYISLFRIKMLSFTLYKTFKIIHRLIPKSGDRYLS